jgi:hypothetical protein
MSDSTFKLQLLVRAELALTKIYARRSLFALAFILLGLGMLNYAAYLGLLDKYTPGVAALLVASADAACAVVIIFIGRKLGPSEAEEKMAKEIRDMAYNEVGKDVEEVKQRIEQLADEVKSIRAGVSLLSKSAKKKPESK